MTMFECYSFRAMNSFKKLSHVISWGMYHIYVQKYLDVGPLERLFKSNF